MLFGFDDDMLLTSSGTELSSQLASEGWMDDVAYCVLCCMRLLVLVV
jgi:hypothetical protein